MIATAVTKLPPEITDIRIVRREVHWEGIKREPFSEVFITAGGQHYYSRLWYAIDDSPFARADQREGFKRRWEAAQRYAPDGRPLAL